MLKKITVVLVASVLAQLSQAKVITDKRLDTYKEAVYYATNATKDLNLKSCYGTSPLTIIGESKSLEVSEGSQPLLVFALENGNFVYKVYVETDANFMKIISINAKQFLKGKINTGTLLDPAIQDGLISESSQKCSN